MAANIVSKLLGAALKIPLTYIMREEGMAVYNTAFCVYVMFLTFVTAGTPFAVQKLTAAAHAKNDAGRAKEIVLAATALLAAAGLIGSAVMWFCADFFALAMKEERAAAAIRAAAPSILLVACGAAVKSGFQGRSDMVPTAVSQVAEAIIKLGAGYALAVMLIGAGTEYSAAGAAAGVTIGEAAATAMLVIWYAAATRRIRRSAGGGRRIIRELSDIAVPLLCMSVIGSAISVCDTSVTRAALLRAGLSTQEARVAYGAYTGYAATVLNLPSGFLATLGVSVVPVISGAAAVGDRERIRSVSRRAIRLSAAAGAAAVIGLIVFGELILRILFRNTYSAPMLRLAAPSVLFVCVMQICGAILQSMGRLRRAFAASVTAALIKLAASALLVSRPELNIYGAALGADIAFLVGMAINLLGCRRLISAK